MNRTLLVAAFAVMLLPFGAAQSTNSNPGLVSPNSPFYGLEVAVDKAAVGVGLASRGGIARERAAEAARMAEKNNTRGLEKAARQLENVAANANEKDAEGIDQAIQTLERVRENAPEQAQQGLTNALENVRKAQNRARSPGTPDQEPPTPDDGANEEVPPSPGDSPSGDSDGAVPGTSGDTETRDRTSTGTGSFTLLVSDRPADISVFDYVNVSFEKARVFPGSGNDTEDETDGNETENETGEDVNDTDMNETEMNGSQEMRGPPEDRGGPRYQSEGNEGFYTIPLNGSTVDLTTVVGENATPLTTVDLDAGTYSKVELYTSSIDASVNGSSVDVKVPPGKLMITKPFTVSQNDSTEFVFDIQVTLRGNARNNQGYILKPVISQSGVAGEDVEVNVKERGQRSRRGR